MGVIRTPTGSERGERLVELFDELQDLIRELSPQRIAMEEVFFQGNARTAMSVAQASGLVFVLAQRASIPVATYTPTQVKRAITGDGSADKNAVRKMVEVVLGARLPKGPADAADALGIALCHLDTARF